MEDLLLCPVDVKFAIDHQGHLFLLQVRPITRLAGGMDFAMTPPEGTFDRVDTGFRWLTEQNARLLAFLPPVADWTVSPAP